jgi:hypothetical protein
MNKRDKKLKAKISNLESKIGKSYHADHAPTLAEKWKKLKDHKIWIEEREREKKESDYIKAMNIHDATMGLFTSICELLDAQGTSGVGAFAVTKNKMEWSIVIDQMGVRNPKTGRIDKKLKPLSSVGNYFKPLGIVN